jgi:HEAT repeat protein
MTMKNIGIKLAAAAIVLCGAMPAFAGVGGSAAKIESAIKSGSVDAIIAEVERAESLACSECVQLVTNLTEDSRYAVREVAAWWFAKRPAMKNMLAEQFDRELLTGGTIKVRNAADFLGATRSYTSMPNLNAAIRRDLGSEAKIAIVRAMEIMHSNKGNPALTFAMADRDPAVRAAAARAWREIIDQTDASPVVGLLADADATVRAEAATVAGAMKATSGRAGLETLVVSDPSPTVRRNAAWALGKIGQAASRDALTRASTDASSLVRMTARVALSQLR